ncbi:hypothetical protein MVI27_02895 [Chryseobacterium salipaludis]|uniref:hypothetical protein n=1 Tax=Chryseobacterium TaxID=59732 RepID=UPI001FF20F72|nr:MULTISPECIES: hypothetical protein [Chryseobacterium]MCJ8497202.1 hypothetical protein [Chryseobacterium salipaludis]MCX3295609.1 hypothetical protein [Planobacterium sp. JC490]
MRVPFTFGEKVTGTEFRLDVFKAQKKLLSNEWEAKKAGSLTVIPGRASESKIVKVVLFNRGVKDINKASYQDTLIARAHCVGLFNREITFQLWEDDAPGPGHHAEINKQNQMPGVFKARVNKNGIAEAKIPLTSNPRVLQAIADKFLMKGDQDEGAYHEYYVTASYEGKIRGASQVNVNVVNPAHKSKPKDNSAIFPGTSAKSPRADQEKKITHAYFVDLKGNPVTKVKVGDTIKVRIRTRNMLNQRIQFVIWEYDVFSDDRIHTSPAITIKGDSMDMPAVTITQALFNKGIDSRYLKDPDRERQQYFIEVIPLKLNVPSSKFGLANSAEKPLEVVRSAAKVNERKPDKPKEDLCFCNRDFKEKDVRTFIRLLKGSERIWEGQALKGGRRVGCNINDKSFAVLTKSLNHCFNKYKINHCAQKMHFLAQVCEETGVFSLSEETKSVFISSQSIYKGRGLLQLTGVRVNSNDPKSPFDKPGPYQDYAEYIGDKKIVRNPEVVANTVDYCVDSGGWMWSIYKKMPKAPSEAVDRWGEETSGKTLNELAIFADKYLELISVLLNGRNKNTKMPNGWEKRKSNYNLLKTVFFKYDHYHKIPSKTISNSGTITFHIYQDGNIEKRFPRTIHPDAEDKYKYVYHDAKGNQHNICTLEFKLAQKWIVGSKKDGGPGWEKRVIGKTARYYQKANGLGELVKMTFPINYQKDEVRIRIEDNTSREYINPVSFASLLGAVAECGFEDFHFNGSTSADGTGAPSVTHVNGVSFDFRYLRKDKTGNNLHIDKDPDLFDIHRQEKFLDALIKFGYSQFYSYNIKVNGKNFILKNSTSLTDHHHHLHVRKEGYNPKYKELKD